MVLVDTCVWIRHASDRAPYAAALDELLFRGEVLGHCLVRGELLMGDRGQRAALLSRYEAIPWAPMVDDGRVAGFVRQRRLTGRGIGWIDAHLLASALVSGHQVWSSDEALAGVARELKVNYTPAMLDK